ncbi:serine/arginine repetitive matrix protein 4 [Denticeps clupeoides]|uniref:serine/arginine repetitive matrix protein 4 n=1 Tax=Denticeps clupeoides TaxID=299321 RepID=UPI0010A59594|nr:serine/arginine repetitive matrix protein 4 [Denticeps clupeoides]
MASLQQGEKQLFEKFWKGTFKAVATPRPESVIVASITARRAVTKSETLVSVPPQASQNSVEQQDAAGGDEDTNGHVKERGHKHRSRHRARSVSFDDELSPHPRKGKKKKKKSQRKRRRERTPSCSLSPIRKKKKKKKKKSSKKRKRTRSESKKQRHSSSSLKRKRKADKKHKKRSRSRSRRVRRRHRSGAEGRGWRPSSTENRLCLHTSDERMATGLGGVVAPRTDPRAFCWGSAIKSAAQTSPSHCCSPSESSIAHSRPGGEIVDKPGTPSHVLATPMKRPQEYDSGNDTSSPPSTTAAVLRSNVNGVKRNLSQDMNLAEKPRFTDRDNASDSGNSVTSYASLSKPVDGTLSSFNLKSQKRSFICVSGKTHQHGTDATSCLSPLLDHHRTRSPSSLSRTRSSRSYRYSSSDSSSSGRRSYSHSSSYSVDSRSGSEYGTSPCQSPRHSRYSPDSNSDREHSSSEKRSKPSRKSHRRKSYSPLRKRRRDSPSHLEARRITSARKRPIPYYRPSPSSSSRSSSVSSWCSLFSRRNRSRSRSRSSSRADLRSRSRSYSTYRSYSRSSSWDSRSRSRSRSADSLGSYSRARR